MQVFHAKAPFHGPQIPRIKAFQFPAGDTDKGWSFSRAPARIRKARFYSLAIASVLVAQDDKGRTGGHPAAQLFFHILFQILLPWKTRCRTALSSFFSPRMRGKSPWSISLAEGSSSRKTSVFIADQPPQKKPGPRDSPFDRRQPCMPQAARPPWPAGRARSRFP